jgi:prophage regulatory protein
MLRFKELKPAGVPFCRMHVDRLEKADKFPRRVRLGENTVAWPEDEIVQWVAERLAARFDPEPSRRGKAPVESGLVEKAGNPQRRRRPTATHEIRAGR